MACSQDTIASTEISCKAPRTATDDELTYVVKLAHNLGLRVLLKPQLDPSDDPDPHAWRGQFGSKFTSEAQWQAWFASYDDFINHYAALAQADGIDMLSVGVELGGTTSRSADWRNVIAGVRSLYSGLLTYSSLSSTGAPFPHGEEQRIDWWDAVDFIGVDAYYPLTNQTNPTVSELEAAWSDRGYLGMLSILSQRFDKQIVFTEFGYASVDGANENPGGSADRALDLQEQADLYQAAADMFGNQPWLHGIFWWQWFADPKVGGPEDTSFTPAGKPAEDVLRRFYAQTLGATR